MGCVLNSTVIATKEVPLEVDRIDFESVFYSRIICLLEVKMKRLTLCTLLFVFLAVLAIAPAAAQDEGLTVWVDETRAPLMEELGAAFEEEFGIPLEVAQLGFGDIRDQCITACPAGEGPDLFIGAHDWLGQLVTNGLVAEVDLPEDLAAQFVPVALEAFTYEGVLYGLPYATENIALFRNTDLVPDAPETWDDVRTATEQIIESGDAQYGYVLQRGDPYHFFPLQSAFGGYVFGLDEETGYNAEDVGIDTDGSIAALDWANSMIEDGLMPGNLTGDDAIALFESGDAAMFITGPWFLERIRDSGVPFAISPIPAGPEGEPGRPFLGVQGFMINAFSENIDLAQAFLTDYVATEETMQALFEAGGRPSAFLPVLEATEDADLAAFGEAGAVGLPMPAIPAMSSVWTAWGDAVTLVFNEESEPEEAFTTAAEQIRNAIAESEAASG
jgi:maltose/maltodextrin transport system substrate-binding protein/arabinogalactan oligomer/maltooligosaccharide transport system substrate-binding protein